jgi:hyperosmotically inducible periplasmic protein
MSFVGGNLTDMGSLKVSAAATLLYGVLPYPRTKFEVRCWALGLSSDLPAKALAKQEVMFTGGQGNAPYRQGHWERILYPQVMKNKNLLALFVFIAGPIALFASSDTDRKIEDAAKASYNYRTVLEGHVKVSANDGIVTLTGTVQDKDDKDLAADTVENLPGVLSVDNQIKVESTYPEHSDAWMAFKIRSTLLVKANVSAIDTKVVVKDGIVTLSGTTQNAAQKDLTEAYAKDIDGVKSVTNDLVVTPPPADQQTVSEKIDDASITSQVKYALLTHGSTSALKTHITTTEGVVAITGEADSDAEKSLVTKLAMDVRGTKSVTNDMTVKS